MKLAAMTFSYMPGTFDEILATIRGLGLDTIDLAAGGGQQVDRLLAAERPAEQGAAVRERLNRYGMRVSEVFLLHFGQPINHPDPETRLLTRQRFTGFASFCREVGAESLMMSPGMPLPEVDEEEALRLSVGELHCQQDVCQRLGLQLNIEPHWHSLAESPERAIWFCEQVPGLGLTLDYSHFVAQGYTQDDVEPLHAYTHHMHARQARLGFTNAPRQEGTIDFRRIMKKLRADRWEGVVCLEYNPGLVDDAPGEMAWLKDQLETFHCF